MKRRTLDSWPAAARALTAGALALLLAAGCAPHKGARAMRVPVTVARVEVRAMPVQIVTTGTVEPVQVASVGSQVGGVVQRIPFREGQDVAAGQLLIELDPRPFRAALEQARANLARDQAQWESARLEAERSDRLLEQNLVSAAEHDRTRATAAAMRAAVRADSAALSSARLNLEYSGIRAPISGRSGRVTVHVGDLVKAATSEPLVTINQIRPIQVSFTVPQSELPRVQRYRDQNPRVFVRPASGDSVEIEGRLAFVDNAVDEASGTLLLKGEFPNADGRLWPGEFVEVRLQLAIEQGAVVVPAPAVTSGQQGAYVYVLNADSTASVRPIRVERSDDVTAVVASGLTPGETVVTDGQFRLAPGSKVLVRAPARDAHP